MRLTTAATAFLSCIAAAASSSPADVYLFRPESTQRDAPQLQRQLARLIFLQRLGIDRHFDAGGELDSLSTMSADDAVAHINHYGKPMLPLFTPRPSSEPSHLLIMVEGLEPNQMNEALSGQEKAFVIEDAPNAAANGKMLDGEFGPAGAPTSSCPLERAINPLDDECFSGSSSIIRFDVKKDKTIIEALQKATPKLARFAETGEMETTLILLPESSRKSRINSWSAHASVLRRQAETVLTDEIVPAPASEAPADASPSQVFPGLADPGSLPLCFTSYNTCTSRTGNCSGHGDCENTWAAKDDEGNRLPAGDHPVCFKCVCKKTRGESTGNSGNGSVTQWAGATCDKVDITTEVSLFVGTGILLFSIIGGAIWLVYSIGEQPLPGVLGAGVSKST